MTPTLNCAATLPATLASLVPLQDIGLRHIIVDSGSDDGTIELAEAAGAEIISFPRGNIYSAINVGMAEARSEWVTYINGDDLLYADAIIDSLAKNNGRAGVVYGNIDHIDTSGRFLFSWRSPQPRHLRWLMKHYCPVPQQGTLFRREVFERMGGFNTQFRFSADYDFFSRCCINSEIFGKYDNRSIAAFRLMPSQLSQRLRPLMAPEGEKIRAKLREKDTDFAVALGRASSTLYRWGTNVDSILLRANRGRNQDSGWRQ
ncbi:MAG: glycosyltransferase [Opitutaceae bacterium]|nr:glycosyltransferase [Opitutaceae bacterium]